MSTTNQVSSLLNKLEQAIGKKGKGPKKDWAAIKAALKANFWKPKEGKNTILIFTPAFGEDPFTFWGYHKSLQEVDYWSVPCDHFNKGEECLVCNVVDGLKSENWSGNQHLWNPIEQKSETYAPIIDYSSPATIAEGPKWFKISKTIMEQLINSIKNLEEGEVPFYYQDSPQRILITYDKNAIPQAQYKIELKSIKDVPTSEQYSEWAEKVQPISEYIFSKSNDELKKITEEYFIRVASEIDETKEEVPETKEEAPEVPSAIKGKLDKLKK